MRIAFFLTLFGALIHSALRAEDATALREKGIAALKESQANPRAIVEAARNFAKAAEAYNASGNEEKSVEMNSFLYWCKKKMTLADIDAFTKGGEAVVAEKLTAVEKLAPKADDARIWLDRAERFAQKNPSEHLLIAIRYYEVADRFKGSEAGMQALDRSLKEQLLDKSSAAKASSPPPAVRTPENAPLSAGSRALPRADELKQAEKLIKELFKADYAKTDAPTRLALAAKLIAQADENKGDAASEYVLLREARDLSVAAGDVAQATSVQKRLRDAFKIDFPAMLLDLRNLGAAAKTAEPATALAALFSLGADDAVAVENYDQAVRFNSRAEDLLPLLKDPALKARLKAEIPRVQALKRDSVPALAALKTLSAKPDDPEANLIAGKFTLQRGEFERAFTMLAKSQDGLLSHLAKSEVASSSDASQQVQLADEWFERAEKEPSVFLKARMQERAALWYGNALPALAGLAKLKIEARMKLLPGVAANRTDAAKQAAADSTKPTASKSETASSAKEIAQDGPPAPNQANKGPKLNDKEREWLASERADLLAKAETEKNKSKQAELLTKAAQNALKLGGVKEGLTELDQIVSKYGDLEYGNVSGRALLAKGQYFVEQEIWGEAEASLSAVAQKYRGSYGNLGCEAGSILAKHFEAAGDMEKALKYHEMIIKCGGSYGNAGAASCNWCADYYLKLKDVAKAVTYLKLIVEKYPGSYNSAKKAAQVKIEKLMDGEK